MNIRALILQSSLQPSLTSIEIHLEGQKNDSFMVSPYPIPSVNVNGSSVVFVRVKDDGIKQSDDDDDEGILITGTYGKETIEIPIENIELLRQNIGCENAILPLFAFNYIKNIEQINNISAKDKKNVIELSISSGVLSKFTGYVGMTKLKQKQDIFYRDVTNYDCCCCYAAAPVRRCFTAKTLKCYDVYHSDDDDSEREELCSENDLDTGDEFDFMLITQLQKVAGFWEDLNSLNLILGLNVNHIDNVSVSDKKTEKRCIATILALCCIKSNNFIRKKLMAND